MVETLASLVLTAVNFAAIFVALRYVRALTVLRVFGALIVVEIIALNVVQNLGLSQTPVAVLAIAVEVALIAFWWRRAREQIRAWRDDAQRAPLMLRSPFVDRWRVAAGGPLRGRNHHLIASDQRFAYDFFHVGGPSLDEPILAPCDGVVVAASDGMPDLPRSLNPNRPGIKGRELGNHVGIETAGTTVFLCHLRSGSVAVQVGERVTAGTPIGRCGNSGRTTFPHLHLHAQDRPVYALFEARGVPVAFLDAHGAPRILDYRDVLAPEPAGEPATASSGL